MNVETLHAIYQIKIQLRGIKPPIWRRLLIKNTTHLAELHLLIQIAMGWEHRHMHQFVHAGVRYGEAEGMRDSLDARINQFLKEPKDSLLYEYDFGDGWQHDVILEKRLPFEPEAVLPVCIGGKRACPPEDIGGIPGYEMCMAALANPDDPGNEEFLEFVVEDFLPESFSADGVNEEFRELW